MRAGKINVNKIPGPQVYNYNKFIKKTQKSWTNIVNYAIIFLK